MELEDLDIPAWVKKAWSQPFAKSDILFRSVTTGEGGEDDWEKNASVRGATDYAYAEGYRRAARILADYVMQNRWDIDFLVYPIVFLYRHNIELQFKRLIPEAAFLADYALSEKQLDLLKTSHRLDRLWEIFEPIFRKLAARDAGTRLDEIEAISSYIEQIHAVDEGSFSFRYMTTKSGIPSIDANKLPHVNIGILAEGMEKLTGYLYGLGEMIGEAVQFKCEMEDEARADGAEDMDHYDLE